jgi:hypothetical protein
MNMRQRPKGTYPSAGNLPKSEPDFCRLFDAAHACTISTIDTIGIFDRIDITGKFTTNQTASSNYSKFNDCSDSVDCTGFSSTKPPNVKRLKQQSDQNDQMSNHIDRKARPATRGTRVTVGVCKRVRRGLF